MNYRQWDVQFSQEPEADAPSETPAAIAAETGLSLDYILDSNDI